METNGNSGNGESPISGALIHSPEIGELVKALAAARKTFKAIKKESVNPYYKSRYADLSAVIEATDEALAAQGIVVVQSPRLENNYAVVTTMLMHSSGQWMRDDLSMPLGKADAHGAGSAITYARRYAYQSFLNVAAEADDDANTAAGKDTQAKIAALPRPPAKKANSKTAEPIAKNFRVEFWKEAKNHGKTEEEIRQYIGWMGYESTSEIPEGKQQEALDWAASG